MAYNEQHAKLLRKSVASFGDITEKKMFGGLCFLLNGNMLCGVHQGGGMARVGKESEVAALELDGVTPLSFTGRKMGGMVDLSAAAIEDTRIRKAVLKLAREFVGGLPAK
ncbi:MAG: TfoX/Sxy family protein [Planctomycetaceae bacterium]|nr:TfoX/Sxy family protein [Planctomycetaceae bacterium]